MNCALCHRSADAACCHAERGLAVTRVIGHQPSVVPSSVVTRPIPIVQRDDERALVEVKFERLHRISLLQDISNKIHWSMAEGMAPAPFGTPISQILGWAKQTLRRRRELGSGLVRWLPRSTLAKSKEKWSPLTLFPPIRDAYCSPHPSPKPSSPPPHPTGCS